MADHDLARGLTPQRNKTRGDIERRGMAGDEKPPGYQGGALTKRRRSKWKVKKLTRTYPPWRATTKLPAPYYSHTRALRNRAIKKRGPKFARIALRNGDPLAPRSGEI